jgi:succinoglycan biosynthesis protein ExoM
LQRLLHALQRQRTDGEFTYDVVIADNDVEESGRLVVMEAAAASAISMRYCTEPRRNIARVRNTCLAHATGAAIALIDDDELPGPAWLLTLYGAWKERGADGVLGPVRPMFEDGAPRWVKIGGFYNRPEHDTGFVMPWNECRTGNVLFDRRIIADANPVFSLDFGTGGEDVDFFRRMCRAGRTFIWCKEAPVIEIVPASRWDRTVMMKRALLRGRSSFRNREGRCLRVLKATIAVPVYAALLPIALLAGQHLFMKILLKLCDHSGCMLASVGITPVRHRAM